MTIKTQKHLDELRTMSDADLREELLRLRREQFENRIQIRSGQLARNHVLQVAQREIARIKTLLQERGMEASS